MYAMLGNGEAEMAVVVEDGWPSRGASRRPGPQETTAR